MLICMFRGSQSYENKFCELWVVYAYIFIIPLSGLTYTEICNVDGL